MDKTAWVGGMAEGGWGYPVHKNNVITATGGSELPPTLAVVLRIV